MLCAVRWYLRYSLSFRDVEELLGERGLEADHTTIWRWVQRYGPALEERPQRHLKPTHKSWRVDETYVRVKAVGATSTAPSIPLEPPSTLCSPGCAMPLRLKRLFRKALAEPLHRQPRVINTDQAPLFGSAISGVQQEGILRPPLPPPACPILEQHPGAGSSGDQTTSEGQAGLS